MAADSNHDSCSVPAANWVEAESLTGFTNSIYARQIVKTNANESSPADRQKAEEATHDALEGIASLPPAVQALMAKDDVEVVGASSVAAVSAEDPALAKYEPEASRHHHFYYRNADGHLKIVITHAGQGYIGDVHHESGHVVNWLSEALSGPYGGRLSDTPEFFAAYNADVSHLSAADRSKLAYFLQGNGRGRDETFAETFMYLTDPPHGQWYPEDSRRYFPRTAKYMEKQLARLRLLCNP